MVNVSMEQELRELRERYVRASVYLATLEVTR